MIRIIPSAPVVGAVVPLNAGDVERVLAYWTEDATVKLVGFPEEIKDSFCGKRQLSEWFTCLVAKHFQFQVKVVKVQGDVVSTRTEISRRDLAVQVGLATLITTESYIVEKGRICYLTLTISPQSLPALQSLLHGQHNGGGDFA